MRTKPQKVSPDPHRHPMARNTRIVQTNAEVIINELAKVPRLHTVLKTNENSCFYKWPLTIASGLPSSTGDNRIETRAILRTAPEIKQCYSPERR